jgi:hypothetical protein
MKRKNELKKLAHKMARLNDRLLSAKGQKSISGIQARRKEVLDRAKPLTRALAWQGSLAKTLKSLGLSYFGSVNSSSKIEKGQKIGFDSFVLYLSPHTSSGINVCPFASPGCIAACLAASGRAQMEKKSKRFLIQTARILKTWIVTLNKPLAIEILKREIASKEKSARRKGFQFCVRLNGTSDLDWSKIIQPFSSVQFYDYSKSPHRRATSNYDVTFSYAENNLEELKKTDHRIAIPVTREAFKQALKDKPETYFSMDKTDLRFRDPKNKKLGLLKVKLNEGVQKALESKFVLDSKGLESLRSDLKC